jgi:hypothetical protein
MSFEANRRRRELPDHHQPPSSPRRQFLVHGVPGSSETSFLSTYKPPSQFWRRDTTLFVRAMRSETIEYLKATT